MSLRGARRELESAIWGCRRVIVAVSIMSGVVNVLALTGSFYMLQVYDRVLTSHSVATLVALSALAVGLYLLQGALDIIRGQVLVRLGARLDRQLMPLAHKAAIRLPLFGASTADAIQPVRDVEAIRTFLGSQAPIAILDLPWIPIYTVFVALLHPWLGLVTVAGIAVLIFLTFLTESLTRGLSREAAAASLQRSAIAEANARNAEVLRAMGMGERVGARFAGANARYLTAQSRASDVTGTFGGVSRVFRMLLQSANLGLGAYLTIRGQITAGAIIAASIASSRSLAPIELAIGHWRGFVSARQGYGRLRKTLEALPVEGERMQLRPPVASLALEGVAVPIPGTTRLVLSNVSFELKAGQGLGIIGPSAAGKSSLVRAITGVWPLARGVVRLDGAALDRWPVAELGRHIGYLPQDIGLFDGTIAENIARFDETPASSDIIAAAEAADVHAMILWLPDGYETRLGPGGAALSGGQRQRLALARALYRNPFLVVLDEPSSNLDAEGEAALTRAMQGVRQRGGIVIVVAHRPSAIAAIDTIATLNAGQLTAFGPKDDVLRKVLRTPIATAS